MDKRIYKLGVALVLLAVLGTVWAGDFLPFGLPNGKTLQINPLPPPSGPDTNGWYMLLHFDTTNSSDGEVTPDTGIYTTNNMLYHLGQAYSPTFYNVTGSNNAFNWDGVDDQARVLRTVGVSNMVTGGLLFFFKLDSDSGAAYQTFVSATSAGGVFLVRCFMGFASERKLYVSASVGADTHFSFTSANSSLTTNTWYSCAIMQDGVSVRAWLNAVEISYVWADQTEPEKWFKDWMADASPPNTTLGIGDYDATGLQGLGGSMDELLVTTNFLPSFVTNYHVVFCPTNKQQWVP